MGIFQQFPYTNFHEMNLDEIISIVKDMLDRWAEYYTTWDDWKTQVTAEWAAMQLYINNYFDNLDVQQEINNKIASMVNSGEFDAIVSPYIPPEVSSWLAAHITQPTTPAIDTSLSVAGAAADAKAAGDAINDLRDYLLETININSRNLFNIDTVNIGSYVNSSGILSPNAAYNASDFIPVDEGGTYTYQKGGPTASGRQAITINQIAGYGANYNFVSGSYATYVADYTVPAGVKYIRFSVDAGNMQQSSNAAFLKSTTVIDYSKYESNIKNYIRPEILKKEVKNGVIYRFDLTSNNLQTSEEFQNMCAYSIMLTAEIANFTGFEIGKGYQSYMGGTLKIDNTNIYVYEGANPTPILTEPHNLTFKDYIGLEIYCNYSNVASLRLYTNGGSYEKQYFGWDARKGTFFVNRLSTTQLINAVLGYYCYGFEKPTYIYGDSYITNAAGITNRWTAYLIAHQNTNYMLNGYPGRGSIEALKALKTDLRVAMPKRIIWCLGMNDGDSGAINVNWKSAVDELISICEEMGIELILATIPNVTTVDNTYKNSYVRSSGYRFIDFAKAVGADSDTTWFDDMLSGDGVHPDVEGAIALYNQAIASVPELIS